MAGPNGRARRPGQKPGQDGRTRRSAELAGRHDFTLAPLRALAYRTAHAGRLRVARTSGGAIAQMGERLNGIQEVRGSIPLGSTKQIKKLPTKQRDKRRDLSS
jgi:hypothetical protein